VIRVRYTANWEEEGKRLYVTRRAFVCALFIHEAGHLLGLGHEDYGVMTANISQVPALCTTPLQRPSPDAPILEAGR
jgi:hypothetical protein